MTILIFIDWYLPGFNAGGPVRSMANLVDHLSGDIQFRIVTRNNDYHDSIPYNHITPGTWTKLNDTAQCCYLSPEQINASMFRKIINEVKPDYIYINGIYSYQFSILPLKVANSLKKPIIVVAPRGMLAESAIGVKRIKKTIFLKTALVTGIYKNVTFHATNENEANQIRKFIAPNANIKIAPNLPKKINTSLYKKTNKQPGKLHLVGIARIAPEKNTLYALQVLNHEYKGEIVFDLYGSVYNEPYWKECKEVMASLPKNISVNYHGGINPEQTDALYQNSHFLFMPTRGENFGHAILESLMQGTPVIISDQTPWKKLEKKKAGWDIPLQNKKDFQKTIQYCTAMDAADYLEYSKHAFQHAKDFCDNPKLIEASRALFGNI